MTAGLIDPKEIPMFAKLEGLEKKYLELEDALAQPDVFNDQEQYR